MVAERDPSQVFPSELLGYASFDFLLTPHRAKAAALAFLHRAIRAHGVPTTITIDQSGSNTTAVRHYNKIHKTAIEIRQSQYLNNLSLAA